MKLCFASRNLHKLQEIQDLVGERFQIVSLDEIGCKEELPETTDTIEGNSHQKADYIWQNYQINCFADDSGLEVEALNGAPGVHSAYYSGSRDGEANIHFLWNNLGNNSNKNAQFKTVITLIWNGTIHQFEGILKGKIIHEKRGSGGFGYDPIFIPENFDQTLAEMSLEQKNQLSARSRALRKLLAFLTEMM